MKENQTNHAPKDIFRSPENIFIIYTSISLILKMRQVLGLEAMLDYLEKYLAVIDAHNPELKPAVTKALEFINVTKVYHDAMK